MKTYERTPLRLDRGKRIYYNRVYLNSFMKNIVRFLEDEDYMHTLEFAKEAMHLLEIKSNNDIEGYKDNLDFIETTIREDSSILLENKERIINLHKGYHYILKKYKIDKENLKELYAILSNGLLDDYNIQNMGKYYRTEPVYILKEGKLDLDTDKGMPEDRIEKYMTNFFEYVNDDNDKTEIDTFIKSQIMHFYFVYIHPYFDVNGRTSRTVAMWHLLNNESYPYIIFNRAISNSRGKYVDLISRTRKTGDITLFLRYMIEEVQKQLEKERVILDIKENVPLTSAEAQIIEYLLSLKTRLTIKDLSQRYNISNVYKNSEEFTRNFMTPLMEKGVILDLGPASFKKDENDSNLRIALNSELIKPHHKNKYLRLRKYMR